MFRLRAKAELGWGEGTWSVTATSEPVTDAICVPDPRHEALGYRTYTRHCEERSPVGPRNDDAEGFLEYDRLRMTLGVPDGSRDMPPGEALLLENNIDELNGIAWDKGCYIGQELTARMKYKAQSKRRLTPVRIEGVVPDAGTLLYDGEREVGEMRSSCGDIGLALLRLDAGTVITSSNQGRLEVLG